MVLSQTFHTLNFTGISQCLTTPGLNTWRSTYPRANSLSTICQRIIHSPQDSVHAFPACDDAQDICLLPMTDSWRCPEEPSHLTELKKVYSYRSEGNAAVSNYLAFPAKPRVCLSQGRWTTGKLHGCLCLKPQPEAHTNYGKPTMFGLAKQYQLLQTSWKNCQDSQIPNKSPWREVKGKEKLFFQGM